MAMDCGALLPAALSTSGPVPAPNGMTELKIWVGLDLYMRVRVVVCPCVNDDWEWIAGLDVFFHVGMA